MLSANKIFNIKYWNIEIDQTKTIDFFMILEFSESSSNKFLSQALKYITRLHLVNLSTIFSAVVSKVSL